MPVVFLAGVLLRILVFYLLFKDSLKVLLKPLLFIFFLGEHLGLIFLPETLFSECDLDLSP